MYRLAFLALLTVAPSCSSTIASAEAADLPAATSVLEAIDKNMTFTSRSMGVKMTNVKGGRTREFKMAIQSKGEDTAAIEYTDPAREAGTKMLRVGDELWMYMPSVARTQKIAGHMLRQGMMGTDVSYEDMMAAGDLASVYDAVTVGAEDCGVDSNGALVPTSGRMCWKLEMTAKDSSVSYPKRTAWIDQEYSVAVRQELFALSGMILKTWTMGGVTRFDESRWFPTKMIITDRLQENTSTTLDFADVKFSVPLAEEVFSIRWLERGTGS